MAPLWASWVRIPPPPSIMMTLSFFINENIWLLVKGVKIALILLSVFVLTRFLKIFLYKLSGNLLKKKGELEKAKLKLEEERVKTLQNVLYSIAKTVIWSITVITILPEFGINIAPLLTGLGIGGLALGFGAKNLIQDYISGLFILIEDQFRVGEEVEIGGKKGKVIDFNLRRTILEDKDRTLHFIPHGQIKVATNFSRKIEKKS